MLAVHIDATTREISIETTYRICVRKCHNDKTFIVTYGKELMIFNQASSAARNPSKAGSALANATPLYFFAAH